VRAVRVRSFETQPLVTDKDEHEAVALCALDGRRYIINNRVAPIAQRLVGQELTQPAEDVSFYCCERRLEIRHDVARRGQLGSDRLS